MLIIAPWTPGEVEALNNWQKGRWPVICSHPMKERAKHPKGEGVMIATELGWKCPYCEWSMDWCHDFMIERGKM